MGTRTGFICDTCGRYEVPHEEGMVICRQCDDKPRKKKKVTNSNKSDIFDPDFVCSKCGLKGVVHRKNKGICKQCEAAYLREWKQRTGKQKEYNKKISVKRRFIKELCVHYLGGKCEYAGGCSSPLREDLEPCWMAFHFHHLDRKMKTFDISRRLRNRGTISNINSISDLRKSDPELIEELDKCILLCSNCHHRLEYCDNCLRK